MSDALSIDLPESYRDFVREQVERGKYRDAGEYIRKLIAADFRQAEMDRIDALLLEGINSGPSIEVTSEYWEEKMRALKERYSKPLDAK